MSAAPVAFRRIASGHDRKIHGVLVGTLVGTDRAGQLLVAFAGAPGAQVVARVATADPELAAPAQLAGRKVVLVFEAGDPSLPLILGLVREPLTGEPAPTPAHQAAPVIGTSGQPLRVNGQSVLLEGQQEIVLRCGQGSITLRADGSIVVKGTRLVSRASEVNKIRGASVQIN